MEVLRRIYRGIVDPNLVVKVRTGTVPGRADIAKDVTAAHVLAGDDREPGKMGVKGLHPVPVIDDYLASIAGPHAGLDYGAVSRCAHSIAFAGRNVDSGVESALPVEGIHTGAEGTGYDSLYRPFRRRVSRVDRPAEAGWKPVGEVEAVHELP